MSATINAPTSTELGQAFDDIGYVILQACVAHDLYHIEVIPALREKGIAEDTVSIVNNCLGQLRSLHQSSIFLRLVPIGSNRFCGFP